MLGALSPCSPHAVRGLLEGLALSRGYEQGKLSIS
jgi:hypothetical protein